MAVLRSGSFHLDQFHFTYPGRQRPSLQVDDLSIEPGEFVLVTGPSAGGKSTFLRALFGLVPSSSGGTAGGRSLPAGLDTRDHGPSAVAAEVGFLFQDPETQGVMSQVDNELAIYPLNRGLEAEAVPLAVEEVLSGIGITHLRKRTVSDLSGGEQQKVALASLLSGRPGALILDEPTSQLDPGAAETLLTLLKRLNVDLGVTIVLAEHRLSRCFQFADRVILIENGTIQLDEPPADYLVGALALGSPFVPASARITPEDPAASVVEARRRLAAGLAEGRVRPREKLPDSGLSDVPESVLRCENIWFSYSAAARGRRRRSNSEQLARSAVLRGLNWELRSGEATVLMGHNGCGKSTLLHLLNGGLEPDRGSVVPSQVSADLVQLCGLVTQNPLDYLMHGDTVQEELLTTLSFIGHPRSDWNNRLQWVLDELDLGSMAAMHPLDLSGGERQRVAIGTQLIRQPRLLALDEPTRGLDAFNKRFVANKIRDWTDAGRAVLITTHDVEFAARMDRISVMGDGVIIADGSPRQVLSQSWSFSTATNRACRGLQLPQDLLLPDELHWGEEE